MSGLWGFELSPDCSANIVTVAVKTKTDKDSVLPPGFQPGFSSLDKGKPTSQEAMQAMQNVIALRKKRMMAAGQAPGKQLFMTGLMLWMSGTGIHIFSIMMTGMAVWNPIKSLLSTNKTFEQFNGLDGLFQAKIMFVFLNGIGLAFGMYKLALMGLLPLKSSDWISLLETRQADEFVGGLSASM